MGWVGDDMRMMFCGEAEYGRRGCTEHMVYLLSIHANTHRGRHAQRYMHMRIYIYMYVLGMYVFVCILYTHT